MTEAKAWFQKGLSQFPGQLYLIDGLSTILVLENQWTEVKDVLLGVVEQQTPFQLLWYHRLLLAAHRLKEPTLFKQVWQNYQQRLDPTRTTTLNLEQQLLFPIAWPVFEQMEDRILHHPHFQ